MGYYAPNPEEYPENPHCFECDEQMLKVYTFIPKLDYYICINPICAECHHDYRKELSEID